MPVTLNEIRNTIQQGDLKNASQQLLEFVNQYCPRFQNEVIGYKARLNQIFMDENRGIISYDEVQRQKNRSIYAMLELIKVLEEEISTKIIQQQKILILTAIPHGLRLDKEIQEIEGAVRRASKRDLFDIKTRTAVRPQDIRRAIREEKPQIVHFCGHGLDDGSLLLEDDGGKNKPVLPQGLAMLFKQHNGYVNCVLLNACHSVKTADTISQHINYVIGMNREIGDKAAIAFAQGFYDGLGYEQEDNQYVFQKAFDEGLIAIAMEDFSQESIPVLKKNFKPDYLSTIIRNPCYWR